MGTSILTGAPAGRATEIDFTKGSQAGKAGHGPVEPVRADMLKSGDLVSSTGHGDPGDWMTVADPSDCLTCGSRCITVSYVDDEVSRDYFSVIGDPNADHYSPDELLVARRALAGAR